MSRKATRPPRCHHKRHLSCVNFFSTFNLRYLFSVPRNDSAALLPSILHPPLNPPLSTLPSPLSPLPSPPSTLHPLPSTLHPLPSPLNPPPSPLHPPPLLKAPPLRSEMQVTAHGREPLAVLSRSPRWTRVRQEHAQRQPHVRHFPGSRYSRLSSPAPSGPLLCMMMHLADGWSLFLRQLCGRPQRHVLNGSGGWRGCTRNTRTNESVRFCKLHVKVDSEKRERSVALE